jgi:CHAD domain-containing protein
MADVDHGGICRFGAKRIGPHIRALEEEIDGVEQNTDTEHVHWMRVASRRLRATLPLFADCFEKREYRRWMRSIKTVTRALGAARDTDVQIAFLENYRNRQEPRTGDMPGIMYLVATLRKQRQEKQADVLAALDHLENEGTLKDLTSAIRHIRKKHAGSITSARSRQLYHAAGQRILTLLDDLLSYESSVRNPDDISGHHALRIAEKKLRYTLEAYRPLYKNRIRPFLKNLKKMQEILGEIHDCDVWAGILKAGPDLNLPSGQDLIMLAQDRKERRELRYQELVSLWSVFKKKKIWDTFKKTIGAGI